MNFTVFNTRFNDEQLETQFNNFFEENDLQSLFTNEHRASEISVSYVDARSIINEGGAYNELFKKFHDYLVMAQDNKSYEEAIFKFLEQARTFQGLANSIKRVMEYIDSILEERKFNTWNIVFYTRPTY